MATPGFMETLAAQYAQSDDYAASKDRIGFDPRAALVDFFAWANAALAEDPPVALMSVGEVPSLIFTGGRAMPICSVEDAPDPAITPLLGKGEPPRKAAPDRPQAQPLGAQGDEAKPGRFRPPTVTQQRADRPIDYYDPNDAGNDGNNEGRIEIAPAFSMTGPRRRGRF